MKKYLGSIKDFFFGNVMILVCLIFIIIGAVMSPTFLTTNNLLSVLRQMAIIGILATGQSIAIISGGIDTSLGGMLSASVIIIALAQALPFPLIVILAIVFAFSFGMLNGTIVSYFKVAPFIITLGMGTVADGLALLLSNGRVIFMKNNADIFKSIGSGYLGPVPYMVIIFIAVVIIMQLILSKTSLGVMWRSIGGNEEAAYWSGINTKKYKILAYGFSGMLAGVAALLSVSRTGVGDPVVGMGLSLDSISAAVLGGTYLGGGGVGSAMGAILGAFILGLINNLFNLLNVSAYWQYIAKGLIIVLAVVIGSRNIRSKIKTIKA